MTEHCISIKIDTEAGGQVPQVVELKRTKSTINKSKNYIENKLDDVKDSTYERRILLSGGENSIWTLSIPIFLDTFFLPFTSLYRGDLEYWFGFFFIIIIHLIGCCSCKGTNLFQTRHRMKNIQRYLCCTSKWIKTILIFIFFFPCYYSGIVSIIFYNIYNCNHVNALEVYIPYTLTSIASFIYSIVYQGIKQNRYGIMERSWMKLYHTTLNSIAGANIHNVTIDTSTFYNLEDVSGEIDPIIGDAMMINSTTKFTNSNPIIIEKKPILDLKILLAKESKKYTVNDSHHPTQLSIEQLSQHDIINNELCWMLEEKFGYKLRKQDINSPSLWLFGTMTEHLKLKYFILAIVLAAGHSIIPGIFRYINNDYFMGTNINEYVIVIIHMVGSLFIGFIFIWLLFTNISQYIRQTNVLKLLIAFTSETASSVTNLPFWIELNTNKNIIAWTNLWELQFLRYKNHPWKRRFSWSLGPILLLAIILLITLFVRYVVLKMEFELFLIICLYDAIILSVLFLIVIQYVISCNTLSQKTQIEIFERILYEMVTENPTNVVTCKLLEAYIKKIQNIPNTVSMLGIIIDEPLFYQFLALLAAGIISAIARIIGF